MLGLKSTSWLKCEETMALMLPLDLSVSSALTGSPPYGSLMWFIEIVSKGDLSDSSVHQPMFSACMFRLEIDHPGNRRGFRFWSWLIWQSKHLLNHLSRKQMLVLRSFLCKFNHRSIFFPSVFIHPQANDVCTYQAVCGACPCRCVTVQFRLTSHFTVKFGFLSFSFRARSLSAASVHELLSKSIG